MVNLAITLLTFAAVLGVTIGLKYLLRSEFMPYQAVVVGRSWEQFDPAVQAIILGMLKMIGGGLTSTGFSILWLCLAIHNGAKWAPWAILTISGLSLGPSLYVSLQLQRIQSSAKTPVAPTLGAIVLIVVGASLSIFALR